MDANWVIAGATVIYVCFTGIYAVLTAVLAILTYLSLQEVKRERREGIAPLVVPEGELRHVEIYSTFRLILKNAGRGPALNIRASVNWQDYTFSTQLAYLAAGGSADVLLESTRPSGDPERRRDDIRHALIQYHDLYYHSFTTAADLQEGQQVEPYWYIRSVTRPDLNSFMAQMSESARV